MTLDEMIARETVRSVVLRHFRAADRVDEALGAAAWWPDGRFEGGPLPGPASEWLPQLYRELLPGAFLLTVHAIASMTVEVAGDAAFVEAYGEGYQLIPAGRDALSAVLSAAVVDAAGFDPARLHELTVGVRYAIRCERRAGEWRIALMQPIVDWSRVLPYSGFDRGGVMDAITSRGRRDRGDPSYAVRAKVVRD